jgi:hypothetical protein
MFFWDCNNKKKIQKIHQAQSSINKTWKDEIKKKSSMIIVKKMNKKKLKTLFQSTTHCEERNDIPLVLDNVFFLNKNGCIDKLTIYTQ